MEPIEQNTRELRSLVQSILYQFRVLDMKAAHGPHVELSVQEVRVVEFLGDQGPRMMRELADYLLLAVNSVTSTVDNLERKALVRRRRSAEDRRVFLVELTEAGQSLYDSAVVEKSSLLRGMLESLEVAEQDKLLALFRKIAEVGQSRIEASRGA